MPRVELFAPRRHDVSHFVCGEESLDLYVRGRSQSDRKRRAAVLYVMVGSPDHAVDESPLPVLGYYTINNFSFSRDRLPKRLQRRVGQYPEVPAILIGRLAIDINHQGRRYGEALLAEALETVVSLADQVAITAVVVHALHETATRFYRRFGFEQFDDNPLHLYYMLGSFVDEYDRSPHDPGE